MKAYQILNREDLGSVSTGTWNHHKFLMVQYGRYLYRMTWGDIHCYTSQCSEAWVVEGFIFDSNADDRKAIRILRNNVPVKRIIKHAIASRMFHDLSLEDINSLRTTLMSLK